jgi:transcriptional regulator
MAGPAHGYAIARWLEDATDDALRVEEGSLYPALHRLEQRGLVESDWGYSENNRRARYYALTRAGRKWLRAERAAWGVFVEVVAKVMAAPV